MTLGEKIKQERKKRKLTQAELAGSRITRNMISLIEKDSANPSFETLKYIAERLGLPLSYLISDGDDAFYFAKKEAFEGIKAAYVARNFPVVVSRIEKLEKTDDELAFLLADAHLQIGKRALAGGSLFTANKHLAKSLSFCEKTCYDTKRIEALANMYIAVSKNIQSPLLELDTDSFNRTVQDDFDIEFYKYLTLDFDYAFTNPIFIKHLEAKKLMKDKDFESAARILSEIDLSSRKDEYNSYAVFGIYGDLELCYKQLCDFEKAYKYSSKRFSLLEGFKT
ncbi:MAG: helix-turn-helix transcriptional regulator [Clostridia bacterium]|nr:helix-turn-helix transcriptional regulator [Clostridia bacterium]